MLSPALPVLVAISGGSDSTALLLRLHQACESDQLFAATVDHGLRPEAADEARWVERLCRSLGVPHATLRWSGERKAAASARAARYDLLTAHAKAIGAGTIALGHTMDDQAETVFMRAMRLKPHSNTRGLSGMTICSHHRGLTLWRPLLNMRRTTLRDELRAVGQNWIDDPSNSDVSSERVRVRRALQSQPHLIEQLGRLASFCDRSRTWLAHRTAEAIDQHVIRDGSGAGYVICRVELVDRLVLRELLSILILAVGGGSYRPALHKLEPLLKACDRGEKLRHAVGRTIVIISRDRIAIEPETRRQPSFGTSNERVKHDPAHNIFRSSADDVIAEALSNVGQIVQ